MITLDIPEINYFICKNSYIGSIYNTDRPDDNEFNYCIKPVFDEEENKLVSSIWYGKNCMDLSEIALTHEEPLTENGLAASIQWITDQKS